MEDRRAAVGSHGAVESLVGHQVPHCSLEETDQTGWQNSPEHCDPLIAILLQVLLSVRVSFLEIMLLQLHVAVAHY